MASAEHSLASIKRIILEQVETPGKFFDSAETPAKENAVKQQMFPSILIKNPSQFTDWKEGGEPEVDNYLNNDLEQQNPT